MDPMEAIKATFFQECEELLADLETGLIAMDSGESDSETVNAVFRAVHSVKGGAGAFGLESLVHFAHGFETTMDAVREGALTPDAGVMRVLLQAADRLADHVAAAKAGSDLGQGGDGDLLAQLAAFVGGDAEEAGAPADSGFSFKPMTVAIGGDELEPAPTPVKGPEGKAWRIRFKPMAALYRNANDPLLLIRELERLGAISVDLDVSGAPGLEAFDPEGAYLHWTIHLTTVADAAQIRGVFEFVDGDCDLEIVPESGEISRPLADAMPSLESLLAAARGEPAVGTDSAVAPGCLPSLEEMLASVRDDAPAAVSAPLAAPVAEPAPKPEDATARSVGGDPLVQTTIRVELDRVDRLIDLVGELVINQAMLAQQVHEAGVARSGNIALGLDDLEQLTREIQDSVMAIRAQPVKSVFQRMPRLVRELANMTGKSVRLITEGEATEVDKTVIERLTDPLTHMIRNAIDHGIETPEERLAAGKPKEGTVRLSAQHRSGRIVIEISDDGRGIDRARVKAIGIKRGIVAADAQMSDEEIDNLIFAPGFSTASAVSDISGRGVGMDVVKRSIQALGGRIIISSVPGKGSTFTLSLPLTLAVLDGMVVSVGDHTLVVPITVIVETLRPKASDIRALGPHGAVVAVRGAHVPLIDVASAMGFQSNPEAGAGVTLLVESEFGGLAALRVDYIQGQRQVVIKSLEQNYDQVPGVAAATIMGDGRVSLILDVDAVISRRRPTASRPVPFAEAS